jgi:hypothetical protein
MRDCGIDREADKLPIGLYNRRGFYSLGIITSHEGEEDGEVHTGVRE